MKDYGNRPQLQKELNIMIRQEFSNSKHKDVYHLTTVMIRLRINAVPARSTLLKVLEDPEIRKNMSQIKRRKLMCSARS